MRPWDVPQYFLAFVDHIVQFLKLLFAAVNAHPCYFKPMQTEASVDVWKRLAVHPDRDVQREMQNILWRVSKHRQLVNPEYGHRHHH